MRILGALTVIIGCSLFGLVRALSLSKAERCIGAVIDSLQYMSSELKASSMPLPELITELAEVARPEVRGFYVNLNSCMSLLGDESFENIWAGLVMRDKGLVLDEKQRKLLCKAGAFMGRFSVEEQAAALESCVQRLETEYKLAADKAREGKKLYPGLGLTAGFMIAAMFI